MYIQPSDQPDPAHQGGPFPAHLPHEVYCIKEVTRIVKAGRSTIYLWMKNGAFPKPRKLSARMVRWRAEDVFRWLAEREMA
ncbi:helix-turn-helix transcriptional regulator [Dyella flava]|uniref:AlpA family phage regulatory protein n=1 Tax=Dyella flava TaxID=1920170 RepID=A0ABS2K0X6_9GAMM|nr:AlpA family phage regulatory protein [Dyella flava]MBM7124408.1 AlpA family phage regulatory protein [Dyella flava]GLQ52496.1 hypothetical protein GCM10010872_39450 [Dyella flava]